MEQFDKIVILPSIRHPTIPFPRSTHFEWGNTFNRQAFPKSSIYQEQIFPKTKYYCPRRESLSIDGNPRTQER